MTWIIAATCSPYPLEVHTFKNGATTVSKNSLSFLYKNKFSSWQFHLENLSFLASNDKRGQSTMNPNLRKSCLWVSDASRVSIKS